MLSAMPCRKARSVCSPYLCPPDSSTPWRTPAHLLSLPPPIARPYFSSSMDTAGQSALPISTYPYAVAALNPSADDATEVRAADAPAESEDTSTPDWVVQTLMSSYNKEDLKDVCKGAFLPCKRTKAVVADRLVAKLAPQVLCGLFSSFYYGEKYDRFPPPSLCASDRGYAAVRSSLSSNEVSALPDASQPAMTLPELARLFKTMADPAVFKVLEAEKDHRTRQELDSGDGPKPWEEHVATLYNDSAYLPKRPEFTCNSLQHINPAIYERKRPSAFLKTKWQDVRRVFDKSYQNYTVSGQSVPATNKDVNNFYTFIPNKASLKMRDAGATALTSSNSPNGRCPPAAPLTRAWRCCRKTWCRPGNAVARANGQKATCMMDDPVDTATGQGAKKQTPRRSKPSGQP